MLVDRSRHPPALIPITNYNVDVVFLGVNIPPDNTGIDVQ